MVVRYYRFFYFLHHSDLKLARYLHVRNLLAPLAFAHLLSGHVLGQRATAVAESPTSKMEEQGWIPAGGAVSSEPSTRHGPHTITWTDGQTAEPSGTSGKHTRTRQLQDD